MLPPSPPLPSPRSRRVRRDPAAVLIVVIITVLLAALIGLPLTSVFARSFDDEGRAVLANLFSPVNRVILINTVVLGLVVGCIGTVIGFIFAFVQARMDFRGKRLLHLIALIPIVSPPFAVATATLSLFGRRGIISHGLLDQQWNIYGLPGLTFVLSLSFFPVAYMNFLGLMRSLDPAMEEAAASLGASKWTIFRTITLPMLIPGFGASFLLLFVEAIADLANPLVIGGDYSVLASRAFIAITGEYNTAAGAAYSLVLLVPAVLVFLVQRYWSTKQSSVSVTGKPTGTHRMITSRRGKLPLLAIVGAFSAIVVTIYVTVILGGFVKILGINNTFTLANYKFLLSGIANKAIKDTTVLALIATPIAGVMGMVIAWLVVARLKRFASVMDFAGMLGLAVPGTVLGIGYALTFNTPISVFGVNIFPAVGGGAAMFGGAIAIVMVYVARSMPAGQRSGVAALQQIDPSIDEASTSLGASGLTTFRRVTLPLIRPAFLTGLTYAFARSMTTVSPIIFLVTPKTRIMTSQILSEVDAGRFGNAFALCTILIVIVLAVIGGMNLVISKTGSRMLPPVTSGL